jgi:hypothetical protein
MERFMTTPNTLPDTATLAIMQKLPPDYRYVLADGPLVRWYFTYAREFSERQQAAEIAKSIVKERGNA